MGLEVLLLLVEDWRLQPLGGHLELASAGLPELGLETKRTVWSRNPGDSTLLTSQTCTGQQFYETVEALGLLLMEIKRARWLNFCGLTEAVFSSRPGTGNLRNEDLCLNDMREPKRCHIAQRLK